MVIVGYVLIALGIVFIVLAAAVMFGKKQFSGAALTLAQILKLLPDLIKALTKAPTWLATTIIGIILVVIGVTLV
jgi:hypothetical protein